MSYRDVSLWFDELAEPLTPRPPLDRDLDVDVAIVGAGYTGLWSAYYLLAADPALRVAVLEKEVAGFGASGRNGGWCSALFPVPAAALAREAGRESASAQYAALRASVDEIERVLRAEGIDADFARGGTLVLARNAAQWRRAADEVREADEYGLGSTLLDAAATTERLAATRVLGATYTPHCAAVQPAKLARGLATAVERRAGRIFERSPAVAIEPHRVVTPGGSVRAQVVLRATEGYTPALPAQRRLLVPVYSLVVATEPLGAATWAEIGLANRETFSDHRHLIVYGQRTASGRLVFGGRGAPYHFGSRVRPAFDRAPHVFAALRRELVDLFPVLRDVRITHRWGGPLGVARDWHPCVGFDAARGLGWAGAYVGDGVSTANLAGRTLTDLVLGHSTELTGLPWVGHRSRRWEPEPLRWLGANAALRALSWADAAEARGARPSRMASVVQAMIGR